MRMIIVSPSFGARIDRPKKGGICDGAQVKGLDGRKSSSAMSSETSRDQFSAVLRATILDRLRVLPIEEIPDHCLPVGPLFIGLAPGAAEALSKIVQHQNTRRHRRAGLGRSRPGGTLRNSTGYSPEDSQPSRELRISRQRIA